MSFNQDVAAFTEVMGPFYEFIDKGEETPTEGEDRDTPSGEVTPPEDEAISEVKSVSEAEEKGGASEVAESDQENVSDS